MGKFVKRKGFIDPETGEIQKFLIIAPKDVDVNFVKVFIPFVKELITDKDLVGKAFRLLLWIIDNLDWNSLKVHMNQRKVSKDLQIGKRTYYRWRSILIEKGILHLDKDSREIFYLRPYAIIRGNMEKTSDK